MNLVRFLFCLLIAMPGAALAQASDLPGAQESGVPGGGAAMPAAWPTDAAAVALQRADWARRVMVKAQALYQAGPLRDGLAGSLRVKFFSDGGSRTSQCSLSVSSGHAAIDALGCPAVEAAAWPPLPVEAGGSWFILPLTFIELDSAVPASGDRHELVEGAP